MKNAAVAALQIAEAESTNNFSPTETHEKATKKGKEEVDSFFRIEQDYQQFNSIKLSTIIHLVESYKSCRKGFSSLLRVLLCRLRGKISYGKSAILLPDSWRTES